MSYEITATPEFLRNLKKLAKRHRSLRKDFEIFIESLKMNPFQGVELSPGLRKIRMAISSKGRGKSGGARIITFNIITAENAGEVFLIDIYDKGDFASVDVSILEKLINNGTI